MNENNKQLVLQRIREAAENLKGRLPDSPRHPSGRNPYAHVPHMIKRTFGMSYTEIPDEYLDLVLELIESCEKYPF